MPEWSCPSPQRPSQSGEEKLKLELRPFASQSRLPARDLGEDRQVRTGECFGERVISACFLVTPIRHVWRAPGRQVRFTGSRSTHWLIAGAAGQRLWVIQLCPCQLEAPVVANLWVTLPLSLALPASSNTSVSNLLSETSTAVCCFDGSLTVTLPQLSPETYLTSKIRIWVRDKVRLPTKP